MAIRLASLALMVSPLVALATALEGAVGEAARTAEPKAAPKRSEPWKPNGKERAKPTVDRIARVLRMLLELAQAQGHVEAISFPQDAMTKRRPAECSNTDTATANTSASKLLELPAFAVRRADHFIRLFVVHDPAGDRVELQCPIGE